jgi:hypothetical protein
MKKLCLLTYGRTGSSPLIGMGQENFKNTQTPEEAYRRIFAVSEIFNSDYKIKSDECFAEDGFMMPYVNRVQYIEDPVQNLAQYIALAHEAEASVFMCKIVIANNDWLHNIGKYIAAMPDFKFVFLTRNVIDCYISNAKARITQRWSKLDTTDIRVDLNLDELYLLDSWANDCVSECSKHCTMVVLDYKELFYQNAYNIEAFNCMLNKNFGDTIKYITYNDTLILHTKQDKSGTFRDAVGAVF